jgi:hypothetical protein
VAVIGLLVVVGILLKDRNKPEEKAEERRNVVITQENAQEMIAQMTQEEVVPITYYTVTMTPEWHFKNGEAASEDAYVENAISNSTDVYFDIFIKGDEENAILKSPIIPRGGHMEAITLDKALDAGEYDCVCIYHLVDEEQNTLSTLRVTVKIIVEG